MVRYPDGKEVNYGYDSLNRLKTVTDRLGKVTAYEYDAIGRRTKTILPNGVETGYDYNIANRLTGITSVNGKQKLLAKYEYQYDGVGNRKTFSETVEGTVYTTQYFYDPINQLKEVIKPDGSRVTYDYDPVGNRKELVYTAGDYVTVTNYKYNEANELTKFNVDDGPFTEFKYDANGNRTTRIEPGNRITSYSYDFENRLTKVQLHQDKWVGFEYDGDGNRITKLAAMTRPWHDNGKGNDPGFVPPGQDKVKKQQAELIFRVLGRGGGNGGGGNSGNGNGNGNGNGGSNGNGGGSGNSGNSSDKGKANHGKSSDRVKNKDLDKNAREKKKEQAKAKQGYRQKGKYTNRGKHLGWYKNGKLQDQVVITNYLNDVSDPLTQVLMTYGEDSKFDAAYTYGLERIEVEALDGTRPESQDPLYYLYDGLGSVTFMVKPDGNKRDHYRYDAYGNPAPGSKLSQDGKIVLHNTFGYTGEIWDEESNLLYLRARYYEPATGRFLSRDSYEGELENPLSKHLYAYVENSPLNYKDPSGHDAGAVDLSMEVDAAKAYIREYGIREFTGIGLWQAAKPDWMSNLGFGQAHFELNYTVLNSEQYQRDMLIIGSKADYLAAGNLGPGTLRTVKVDLGIHFENLGQQIKNLFKGTGKVETSFGRRSLGAAEYKPTNINSLKDSYLKKNGFDPHAVKAEALGTKKDLDKFDIFMDKDTGQLWVFRKGGKGEGIPTGEYIRKR